MATSDLPEFRKHGFDQKFVPLDVRQLDTAAPSTNNIVRFLSHWTVVALHGLKILDLGCGRGELVAALRLQGARAFGIEIDPRFIESGRVLCDAYRDEYPVLSVTGADGTSIFPDGFFDVVVSDQVLEHVSDLRGVTAEIARILRPGGMTCHQFPARFRLVEPHYKLPLAHWLPKSPVRRAAIKTMLAAGLSSQFFPEYSLDDRASIIFKYSVEETFYRPVAEIESSFRDSGLPPTFAAGMHAYLESRLGRHISPALPLGQIAALFKVVMFTAQKPAG